MSAPLFLFSQLNPLDNVPVHFITQVSRVGDKLIFHTVDEDGNKEQKEKPLTEFALNQIHGFNIEYHDC